MQNVYYIDSNFIKEILHNIFCPSVTRRMDFTFVSTIIITSFLVFFFQPYQLDSQDAVIAKVKKSWWKMNY